MLLILLESIWYYDYKEDKGEETHQIDLIIQAHLWYQ